MSAHHIFELAPLGAIIAWSDGLPRPPERHVKKLAAWKTRNSFGRLVRKEPPRQYGNQLSAGYFTLHEGNIGGKGTILLTIHRTFGVDSTLTFEVKEMPATGSVLVLDGAGADAQLLHLAPSSADAEAWLKDNRHPRAVVQELQESVSAAPSSEGRAAA